MGIFQTLVERPIFNLLEIIYALVPGHDLGVAIIIFTALIRLALWPLVKKQLHHTKKMRKLAPELKKIKKAAGGDRQKEAKLQMEFYKEHEIKPFGTIGTLIVQIPIFIALYQSVSKLIRDPEILQSFSYDWVRNLPWIKHLADNPDAFHHSLFGLVDLSQKGLMAGGGLYFGAIVLAVVAAFAQYYQSKSLLVDDKDAKKLSDIMKSAAAGEQADQSEVAAAVSRSMLIFMPFMTFLFSINLPSALSLYLITSSVVGYFQQRSVLREDAEEMSKIADIPEAKVVSSPSTNKKPKSSQNQTTPNKAKSKSKKSAKQNSKTTKKKRRK